MFPATLQTPSISLIDAIKETQQLLVSINSGFAGLGGEVIMKDAPFWGLIKPLLPGEIIRHLRKLRRKTTDQLKRSFSLEPYPNLAEVTRLRQQLGLTERQITMWFTNRRCRIKRKSRAAEQSSGPSNEKNNLKIPSSDSDYSINDKDDTLSSSITSSFSSPIKSDAYQDTDNNLLGSITSFSIDEFFDKRDEKERIDVEFYRAMMCTNTRSNWQDLAVFFANDVFNQIH